MRVKVNAAFPTYIGEFYTDTEPWFKYMIDVEERIGTISDDLNLARVSNITSSYNCNQVRLKLHDREIPEGDYPVLTYEWEDDDWKKDRNEILELWMRIADIYIEKSFSANNLTGGGFSHIIDQMYVQDAWFVRYKEGDYNYFHTHPESVLSGVLFLEVPNQIYNDNNFPDGYLSFLNDGVYDENTLRFGKSMFVKPEIGKLVVFPSSLGHLAYPFKGPGTRKVLSINWGRRY